MIKNQNRSKWFGASDTAMIMSNWSTESFKNWWLVKLGITQSHISSWVMDCGNIMEIPIIRFVEKLENRKIHIGKHPYYNFGLRLRCNYDGLRKNEVVEIKTSGTGFKKVPKNYWQQCQVLMWRKKKERTSLYLYLMRESDYLNPYFPELDKNRLVRHEIVFDKGFIVNEYLPRLRYLARCLRLKILPKEEDYVQYNNKNRK